MLRRISAVLAVLVIAGTCLQLGRWQLHRLDERRDWNQQVQTSLDAQTVPITQLLATQAPQSVEWRAVAVTGRFDRSQELLIRGRYYLGQYGYEVITPLVTSDGRAVLVNRGWIAAGASATTVPSIPEPPSGEVSIIGRMRSGDAVNRPGPSGAIVGLPARAANRIDPAKIATTLPYPVFPGYIELMEPKTKSPIPVAPPELSEGPHLAYAVQWFFFGGLALIAPFFYRRIGSDS